MMDIQIIHLIEDRVEGFAETKEVRSLIIPGVISIGKNDILILTINSNDIITIFSREKPSSS